MTDHATHDEPLQASLPLPVPSRCLDSQDVSEIQFVHSNFALITLPRSRVEERVYQYQYRSAAILIEAGSLWDGERFVEQCVPYGSTARLIHLYICTAASQNRSQRVFLGRSLTDFVSTIRGRATGGERGTIRQTVEQLAALAACKMSVGVSFYQLGERVHRTTNISFAGQFESGFTKEAWPSEIVLNEEFYESLVRHSLPVDMRAVQQVSSSAMALDLLLFFAHRLPRCRPEGEMLSWANLVDQFGGRNAEFKSFKRFVIKQIQAVLCAYQDAKVELVHGGIFMRQSKPLVPKVQIAIPQRLRAAA